MKKLLSLLLALALVFSLAACGSKTDDTTTDHTQGDANAESVDLVVFAAASMTETLTEIAEMYKKVAPNVNITYNFDSSGKLLTQISEGADCDLFISAAPQQMNAMDGSLIGAYGHDDRVCGFAALQAILDIGTPEKTAVCVLADKEEIGSMGVTGMQSAAFDTFMNDLCESQNVALRVCYENAFCLSADVTAAYDPNFADVYEKRNAAFVNHGVGLCKYTGARGKSGSSDANAETVGYVRGVLDKAGVRWQICEMGKIDAGGGGTVAQYMANRNIATLDAGVPVLSMHAPFEVVAKLDCYEMYRACKALYESL